MSDIAATVAPAAPEAADDDGIVKKKKVGVFFWIFAGWVALVVLTSILAPLLGLQDPNNANFDAINQGPIDEELSTASSVPSPTSCWPSPPWWQ